MSPYLYFALSELNDTYVLPLFRLPRTTCPPRSNRLTNQPTNPPTQPQKNAKSQSGAGKAGSTAFVNYSRLFNLLDLDHDKTITIDEWAIVLRRHVGLKQSEMVGYVGSTLPLTLTLLLSLTLTLAPALTLTLTPTLPPTLTPTLTLTPNRLPPSERQGT